MKTKLMQICQIRIKEILRCCRCIFIADIMNVPLKFTIAARIRWCVDMLPSNTGSLFKLLITKLTEKSHIQLLSNP